MPFGASMLILLLLTITGSVGTLVTLAVSSLRPMFPVVWRMWLWGTLGVIVANAALVAVLVPSLSRIGIAHGPPPFQDRRTELIRTLLIVGPLVVSVVGLLLGTKFGFRRASRPSNQRLERP
jgi:hypothetical protein